MFFDKRLVGSILIKNWNIIKIICWEWRETKVRRWHWFVKN